jgi:hypothetical protein
MQLSTNAIVVTLQRGTSSRLRWASENQLQYRLLKSEVLLQWSFVGARLQGTGSPIESVDSSTASRCYYRVIGFK